MAAKLSICFVLLSVFGIITSKLLHHRHPSASVKSEVENPKDVRRFFHLSDTHLDMYFDPTVSNAIEENMCRTVALSSQKNSSNDEPDQTESSATYGRVKCDTPVDLLDALTTDIASKNTAMVKNDEVGMEFILMTGRIFLAMHGKTKQMNLLSLFRRFDIM